MLDILYIQAKSFFEQTQLLSKIYIFFKSKHVKSFKNFLLKLNLIKSLFTLLQFGKE